jgi:hypothetical protein
LANFAVDAVSAAFLACLFIGISLSAKGFGHPPAW